MSIYNFERQVNPLTGEFMLIGKEKEYKYKFIPSLYLSNGYSYKLASLHEMAYPSFQDKGIKVARNMYKFINKMVFFELKYYNKYIQKFINTILIENNNDIEELTNLYLSTSNHFIKKLLIIYHYLYKFHELDEIYIIVSKFNEYINNKLNQYNNKLKYTDFEYNDFNE